MSVLKENITEELYKIFPKKTCCIKAYICGLIFGAQKNEDGGYTAFFYSETDAQNALLLINSKFAATESAHVESTTRGGHRAYALTFFSKALCVFLHDIDNGKDIMSAAGFRCASCAQSFVRGLIISSAKISQPKTGYNLEFSVVSDVRADALAALLCEHVETAGQVRRQGRIGLYYKSSQSIFDLLQYAGAAGSAYKLYDTMIERNMRNNANRSTNCTTSNILRAVDSNRRVIEAIRNIFEYGREGELTAELEYTARLRVENDSASLSELAMLHEPMISKSGLNSRLKKLVAISEKGKKS